MRYSIALPLTGLALLAIANGGRADDLILKKSPPSKPAIESVTPGIDVRATRANSASKTPIDEATAKRLQRHRPRRIELEIAKGQSASDAWSLYFSKQSKQVAKISPAQRLLWESDVRETVRRLMAARQFTQVSAVIQSAIRHGQPQKWMYHALGLAMLADNAPQSEIERAFMSAVDFSGGDPAQMSYIAGHMAQVGLNHRALRVFRQVSEIEPTRPEPYVLGLAIAQRIDDLDGIKWASLGILSQEWPGEQKRFFAEATVAAKAVVNRLREEKRFKEADQFEAQRADALVRDLYVKVSWTGNADIDISMVEPTGTICSFRNPRTTAGGVMLGDSFAHLGNTAKDGLSEIYVCPKGFNGTYRLMMRRIWGQVTTGKVTVEILSHHKKTSSKAKHQVELQEGVNVVSFDLKDGRRIESLAERQVVTAVREQAVLGRAILAQHLGNAIDPRAAALLGGSRAQQQAAASGQRGIGGVFPLVGQSAVGFRPVITKLPEGANMAANAVVSADRRYVRITVLPLFSQVGRVLAFNIITGQITDGDPDFTGGRGGGGGGPGNQGPER